MLTRALLSLLTLTTLSACGSGGGSGAEPMKPLSPEQKSKVHDVTDSMSAAQGAASQGRGNGFNLNPDARIALTTTMGVSEKTRQLGQKLQEGRCNFDNTLPTGGGSSQNGEFHLKVGGPTCPIRMEMRQGFATKQSANSIEIQQDFLMSYAVNSTDFAQLNDVSAIEFKGGFKGQGDQKGGSFGGRLDGFVQSQRHGKLPLYMTMSMSANKDGSTSTMTIGMTFPDFSAVGKIVGTSSDRGGGENTYYVNDQKVSADEFKAIFGDSAPGKN